MELKEFVAVIQGVMEDSTRLDKKLNSVHILMQYLGET